MNTELALKKKIRPIYFLKLVKAQDRIIQKDFIRI